MAALIKKDDGKWLVRALIDGQMQEYEYADEAMARKKLEELNKAQAKAVLASSCQPPIK